jgi:uncharacterized protein
VIHGDGCFHSPPNLDFAVLHHGHFACRADRQNCGFREIDVCYNFAMATQFEWDPKKAKANLSKHDVSFEEASTIFDDPLFITFLDTDHSVNEERYITIGLSRRARLLMVAHAERNNRVRIISARKATKNEEKYYQEAG